MDTISYDYNLIAVFLVRHNNIDSDKLGSHYDVFRQFNDLKFDFELHLKRLPSRRKRFSYFQDILFTAIQCLVTRSMTLIITRYNKDGPSISFNDYVYVLTQFSRTGFQNEFNVNSVVLSVGMFA